MTTISLQADETLLEQARVKAREQHTTLDQLFGEWLKTLATELPPEVVPGSGARPGFGKALAAGYRDFLGEVQEEIVINRKYTRDEMNER